MAYTFHKEKSKNWLRTGCIIAFSVYLTANSAKAQVTIGSGNPPAKGALLDLKENDAPNGNTTTTKGVVLPRVNLTGLNSLEPLLSAADAADPTEKTTHRGLIVYNLTTTANLQEGLYCWDGAKWVNIAGNANDAWLTQGNAGTNAATHFIGTTDNQPLVFRINNTPAVYMGVDNNIALGANTGQPEANRMNIGNVIFGTNLNGTLAAPAGNIGIRTTTPTSTVTVNGSIAGSYHEITETSYDISPTDYVISYIGTADVATLNLPTITTAITGRVYYIKNLTTNCTLTISGGAATLRRGGASPTQSTMTVPPGYHTMIVANANTSGQAWDVLSLQDSHVVNTGWVLVATDIISIINQNQDLTLSNVTENLYFDVINTDLEVTVPADLSGDNRVLLRWDVWGDVSANIASGSIRFAMKEESDARVLNTYESIMTTSWSTPVQNYFRWSAPIVFGLKNVPPGTYTFTLQARRESEVVGTGGSISVLPKLWGAQGKAEVYIK
ncbi:MAG: hypothetical protein LBL58_18380 [Tannerellaceae bacterium]|jgi:hypothetical protein|nr:hypothetical protein [Tannerellaceae bacterium]